MSGAYRPLIWAVPATFAGGGLVGLVGEGFLPWPCRALVPVAFAAGMIGFWRHGRLYRAEPDAAPADENRPEAADRARFWTLNTAPACTTGAVLIGAAVLTGGLPPIFWAQVVLLAGVGVGTAWRWMTPIGPPPGT